MSDSSNMWVGVAAVNACALLSQSSEGDKLCTFVKEILVGMYEVFENKELKQLDRYIDTGEKIK